LTVRVSFDLDDTLICQSLTPTEPPLPSWRRWRHPEPLRLGAASLIRGLRTRDCSVWVYTTSFRSPASIRGRLRAHGTPVDAVVNQDRHDRVVGRSGPSKYPPAFGIDLHVDDLPGVATEGARHGFEVLIVALDDPDWYRSVLKAVDKWILTRGASFGPI